MRDDEIKAVFDQQAPVYDERWRKTAPIRDALYFLLDAVFAELPVDARVLCVGVGTGEEIGHLAARHRGWTFVAVDPSEAMIEVCRGKARAGGFEARCDFHAGYLASLPQQAPFDGATSFLVSQFILDPQARSRFFADIAARLRPSGVLASSDLASDVASAEYTALLDLWMAMMTGAGIPGAGLEQMRAAYAKDVAILPPARIANIIRAGGLDAPTLFYQCGLIHAWCARRPRAGRP